MIDMELYQRLIENRPFKFGAEDVNYQDGEGEHRCATCIHFFTRKVDGFHTCEIFRPSEDGEESVIENYRCDFWSDDGEDFPYQKETLADA